MISHYQKISKTQILEKEMIFIFLESKLLKLVCFLLTNCRIKLQIIISRTNVLILTHAMFAKESKKEKTISQPSIFSALKINL